MPKSSEYSDQQREDHFDVSRMWNFVSRETTCAMQTAWKEFIDMTKSNLGKETEWKYENKKKFNENICVTMVNDIGIYDVNGTKKLKMVKFLKITKLPISNH